MADRYTIGKPHPDRAAQFKPFAALKGYYDLLEAEEQRASAQLERVDEQRTSVQPTCVEERHASAQPKHAKPHPRSPTSRLSMS